MTIRGLLGTWPQMWVSAIAIVIKAYLAFDGLELGKRKKE
jgi:hypothetical protein